MEPRWLVVLLRGRSRCVASQEQNMQFATQEVLTKHHEFNTHGDNQDPLPHPTDTGLRRWMWDALDWLDGYWDDPELRSGFWNANW